MTLIAEIPAGTRWNERRTVVKEITKYIADAKIAGRSNRAAWCKFGWVLALTALLIPAAWAQPANDLFTNAITISGNLGTVTNSNVGATLENCEPTFINADDFASVVSSAWYAWTPAFTGVVEFDTFGSSFDTVLAVYTTANGLCDPSLTLVTANDDSTNAPATNAYVSQVTFNAIAGTTYYLSVNGNAFPSTTNVGNFTLNWNLANSGVTQVAALPSGTFQLTAGQYAVSERESQNPDPNDGGTVNQSVPGARLTVTRSSGYFGRVQLGYVLTPLTYTNIFTTNISAVNTYTSLITNTVMTSVTNTAIISNTNDYGYYEGGYLVYEVTGTNATGSTYNASSFVTPSYTNVTMLVAAGGFGPYPTNAPPYYTTNPPPWNTGTNNYIRTNLTSLATDKKTFTNYFATNFFQPPSFTTNLAGLNYTNSFNTNTYTTSTLTTFFNNNGFFSTNYIATTIAYSNYYSLSNYVASGAETNYLAYSSNIFFVFGTFNGTLVTITNLDLGTNGGGTTDNGYTNYVTTVTYTNTTFVTNIVLSATNADFTPTNGLLTLDNYQMSEDLVVPVNPNFLGPDGFAAPGLPRLFQFTITNAVLDPSESLALQPPVLGGISSSIVSILSDNFVTGDSAPPTNSIVNFERATFRVDKDVAGSNAVVSVIRTGGSGTQSISVQYEIDPTPPIAPYSPYNTFPLSAGSDYAIPNSDFTPVTGTLTWGAGDFGSKQITIPILDNGLVEPNVDMLLKIFNYPTPVAYTDVGEINEAHLTILFNDTPGGQQPAGAVDRTWNQDNVAGSNPPFLLYPGTSGGNGGQVYSVVEQPDGNALVAGSFVSFDSTPYSRIVRLMTNGYQDPTFLVAPNTGANDFIAAMALQPNGQIVIGGNFTSFNGTNRFHVARLNTDGSLDTTFDPGLGANGMVWSVNVEPNGQILIGGEFTSYNGTNVMEVARLNPDGSLDTSFVPGPIDGIVSTVAVDPIGRVLIGGTFNTIANVNSGGIGRLNVNGSLDTTFNPGIGTYNQITGTADQVYAITLQPDGQILVGGAFSEYELSTYNGILRLNTDGSVDPSFDPGTGTYNPITGVSDTVYAITLQTNNTILVGGDFQSFNETPRAGITRLFSYGSVDTSFMDTAYNEYAGIPNRYINENAYNPNVYPPSNTRNLVYSIGLEAAGNVIIGGSFFRVGGGYSYEDVHNRSNVARLIGGATPGPGNIEFSYSRYNVDKTAGTLFVSLVRTNGNLGAASVRFGTTAAAAGPGVATANDYTLLDQYQYPTWPTIYSFGATYSFNEFPGVYGPNYQTIPTSIQDPSPYVYLNISNNVNNGGNLSANLAISYPFGLVTLGGEYIAVGTALGPQSAAPLTIIDTQTSPGILSFSSPSYFVNENGTNAVITVTRTGGSQGIVQVSYATANGTATNGVNYTAVSGVLTFLGGVTNKSFNVPITAGTAFLPDKTVNLSLYNVTGGATLGSSSATLTIINNNFGAGQVNFTQVVYGTNENAKTAYFTVSRLGGSTGTLVVTNSVSAGSAANGINFTGSTNVLSWNSGDVSSRTIAVPVFDDGVVTTNLTVKLALYGSLVNTKLNPNALGIYTNSTLIITNVDAYGTVQFSAGSYSVKKYAGFELVPVERIGGSAQTITVNYATTDGTAVAGKNYTAVSGALTFTSGQVVQYIHVPILDDGASDGPLPLAFNLVLSGASPTNSLGAPNVATNYIVDTYSINEMPGSPDATFASAAGCNSNIYALAIQSNNQILVGGDFTMANGVTREHIARLNYDGTLDAGFLLPSSDSGANGSIRAIEVKSDGRILIGGTFSAFNSAPINNLASLNSDGTLDSTFNPGSGANNSVYAISETFVNGVGKVVAGGAFTSLNGYTFNAIGRLNSDGTPDSSFNPGLGANATVYALAVQGNGQVIIGGDFTAVNGATNFNHLGRLNVNGSVDANFNVGGQGAGGSVRALAIQPDGKILIGGLFTNYDGVFLNHIARLNSDGSVDTSFVPGLGANDVVYGISLQTDGRIVLGGAFTDCNGVTRNRITRLNPDGTVDPTINFGTGANNFIAAVAVQEGTVAGYPTNVPDEKIVIAGGFTQYAGQPFSHLARIYGGSVGGSGSFQFTSANYQVDELGTNIVITVQRFGGTSGTNTDLSGDIFVPFATSDGTATAGVNYTAIATNLDFPKGEVIKTVTIPVFDDGLVTSNLTVNLAVGQPFTAGEIGNQPTALLTIINDDSTISFGSATYSVPKNIVSGVAAINVVRLGSTYGTSTVNFYTTTNGSAAIGTDYTPVQNTLVFAPGVSNLAVSVPINNNGLAEGNRTVGLQLGGITGSQPAAPTNSTLTIIDTVNAPGQLTFSALNYTVNEGGGVGDSTALITVLRTNGTSGIISVNFSTQDGTALSGLKYVATNGALTFGDGQTSQTFGVKVVNTTTAEGPQYLLVNLSNPTGGAGLTPPTTATVTILNTNTGLAFAFSTNSFTEPSGQVDVTVFLNVIRFNNTNGVTTVNYSTFDGSPAVGTNAYAQAGINYVGVTNGLLTFNPGDSVQKVPIQTIHDPAVTGDLYFTVALSNPSPGAQLTYPSSTTVIDHDAESGIAFDRSAANVFKTSGYAVINVVRSNTNVDPVTVSVTTVDGTAVAGVDYTKTAGSFTFAAGQATNTFYVPILVNNQVGANKSFSVSLYNAVAPGVVLNPSNEVVTIIGTNTPFGLSFSSPIVIQGNSGSSVANNTFGAPENGDPTLAGYSASAPVWFAWKAPADGEVSLDTIGSVTTNGVMLDTLLGVFVGYNLNTLNQVAVNDDLYPSVLAVQQNIGAQNIFNTNNYGQFGPGGFGNFRSAYGQNYFFSQPFAGPSGLRFNAHAGVTYYIEADTKTGTSKGRISLNWSYHSSGVFRFASETVDQTGIIGTNVNPTLLYQCSETEGTNVNKNPKGFFFGNRFGGVHGVVGPTDPKEEVTTLRTYYSYDVAGLLVTITRVGGSAGRVSVDYTTENGDPSVITNGDIPAIAGVDYTGVSGTLIFDDFEMSKTIYVPIIDDGGTPQPNRDFVVALSNPQVDPQESVNVSAPRLDPAFSTVACRILDCDIDPKGPTTSEQLVTNTIAGTTNVLVTTNLVVDLMPTNALFNFSKANYRVPRDVTNWYGSTPITVYVNRMGTNIGSVTLHYRIDNEMLANDAPDNSDNEFPLQPGSDYATPFAANPPIEGGIYGSTNFDFQGIGGSSGTITFPGGTANTFQSQPIHFTVFNNGFPEFNKDFNITLYEINSQGVPQQDGMVANSTVTILFDDYSPPAGSVDEFYNPDFAVNMAVTNLLGTAVVNPGTEPYSEVYSLALLPTAQTATNQSVIAGAFTTYTDGNNTYTVNGIARLNGDGSLDTTFNSGAGINVFPGGEFIRTVLLTSDYKFLISGDFASYNGVQRNSVARLFYNGRLDPSFNPGAGVNGTVWAMALQTDGKVILAGDFTSYNNTPAQYVARVNPDGSLDTTFNASTNLNAAVYAAAVDGNGNIVLGGAFTSAGGRGGQNRIVRLNPDGTIDTSFNTVTGPNATVRSLTIQPDGKVLAGGEFTQVAGQTDNHLVRFNSDGSLDSSFFSGTGPDGIVYNINYNTTSLTTTFVVTNVVSGTNVVSTNYVTVYTNSIYLGGAFTEYNGTHRYGFARLYPDGTLDTTFLDTAYNQYAGLPRIFYGDAPGTVYSSAVQPDGNVLIAGSFQQVGGGEADASVRDVLEYERGLVPSFADTNLWVSEGGQNVEPKTRDGVRIRGNVARLIGGATPGPGNIGMASPSYAVNKAQFIGSISLIRTNGNLGYASANFAVIPGLATSGADYLFNSVAPLYPEEWTYLAARTSRVHSDGLYGSNGLMADNYNYYWKFGYNGPAAVNISVFNNPSSAGNLNASLQMANPVGQDQFYLGGANIPLGVALGESVAPLTFVDNTHQDGVFNFAYTSFVATNSLATISIARTNSAFGTVQVSYQTVTNGSTAVAGTDYRQTNGVVVFNPGQTTNTFPLTILQDSYIGTTERNVNLQLYNIQDLSGGNASLGLTNAVLRIINPNFQGYISLTTNYYTANQNAGTISFTVERVVGNQGTLTVQYATTNGTAINGQDYRGATNTLTWNNGDVSPRTVSITLLTNTVVGPAKQFAVNIYNSTLNGTNWPSLLSTPTSAVLNINNNNSYGTFQFSAAQYRVNDNGGNAIITVTRTGSALGAAQVGYSTADASAVAGANYVATSGNLAFAQGQLSATFAVPLIPDTKPQPPPASFYFKVLLTSNSAGTSLGTPASATVNIVDSLTFNQPPGSIDPSFDPNLLVNAPVLALAQQSDGQVVLGGLFTAVDGAALNHMARLNLDGSLDTGFMAGLAGANGAVNALVNQTDDRILIGGAFANVNGSTSKGVARLMIDGTLDTSFVVGAGADSSVFALAETFINGSRELYVGGGFSTFNGVYSPGIVRLNNNGSQDTTFATGIGAGGTVFAITPYPTNAVYNNGYVLVGGGFTNFNNVVVGNLVRLTASGAVDTNFAVNLGANATVRTIALQPDGKIVIGGDFTNVNGVVANHLARLNSDGSLDAAFALASQPGMNGTVNAVVVQPDNRIVVAGGFNQANGLNRNDLTRINADGSADPTINFGDGGNGAVNAVVIQATNNFLVIGGAFTTFEDQPVQYITRLNGGSVVGSGQFSFNSANYQVAENGGFALVTIVRNGGSSGDVKVMFATSNGTALAGTNYTGITNILDFPSGQVFTNLLIPVMDDQTVTPNLTVNLSLALPPGSTGSLGNQSTAVLTIINVDSGVSFATPNYSVPKNTVTGVANIDIIRQGSTSGACTVNFATITNGTAVIGTDYYPTNATVTFDPGISDVTVQVPIIKNNLPEGPRTVAMIITNATGVVLTSPTNAILTIIDTVNAPGQLFFVTNSYTVLKANGNVLLTVGRTNGSSGNVSVNYNTTPGTALAGINYLPSSGTLTLGDGVTSGNISIPIVDNTLAQGTVNFNVDLFSPGGGATLRPPTNAVVNIVDHNVGVSFLNLTNYATQPTPIALVPVQRLGATNQAFSVTYVTTNLTALAGSNYVTVSNRLYFASGQVLQNIGVPLLNSLATSDLQFGLYLTNADSGVQLVNPTNTVVIIHAADAGLSFNSPSTNVLKNAGFVTLQVICSNPQVEPVVINTNIVPLQVSYYTTNGTATAGIDYTAVKGTLTFTNGIATNYITVPIINNGVLAGNRSFSVVLANPTAPGVLIPPSTTTVNIIDINSGVEFSSPTYNVLKTGIQANITVYRTGFTDSIVTVNYTATNGTAIAGVNFVAQNGSLTFTNGITTQSFSVPIISSTLVQPDLTVFLQLFNPTNAALTYPSFSTLTIQDPSGSTVVPAGAVLVEPEGFTPANGIIDPGERDTLRFAFRDSSSLVNVTNLIATLLATNGITQPSGPQIYGPLLADGPSVSRPFTFTANGTNGQAIVATFKLTDGARNLGTNTFTFYLGTWSTTYSNTAPIIINDFTTASPYPAVINISGLAGTVLKTTVTFTNLSHTSPSDIGALLVAPNQQSTLLMENAGAGNAIKNVTLTFDDAATNSLPQYLPPITSGTNKPTAYPTIIKFP